MGDEKFALEEERDALKLQVEELTKYKNHFDLNKELKGEDT